MMFHRGSIRANLLLLIAAVAVLAGGGWAIYALLRPQVVVTEATVGPAIEAFYATGTVQPQREFEINTSIAGIVTKVNVDKGDRIKKGQVLAVVSDPAMDYAVQKADAELKEKQALADLKTSPALVELDARIEAQKVLLDIAQRERDRQQDLIKQNAASQSDLDRSLERYKQAWGDLEALQSQRQMKALALRRELDVAEAALQTARWNQQLQTVKSPINGVVLDRPVSQGTRVAANDHLMQTADLSPSNLVMRAAVDEEDHDQLREDQLVQMVLYSFAGQTFEGRVDKIYDQADPNRRTFEVDIRFTPLRDRLAPGMTGELAFITQSKEKAITVPTQALQEGKIWSVENGRAHRLDVKIGLKNVQRVEVSDGLQPGQLVILSSVADLADGDRVRTRYEEASKAAAANEPKGTGSFKGFNP
jgi:multidrug efflux pump subunit AcrA (membrane-fusion protein)